MDVQSVLDRLAGLASARGFTLVGIGGRGGAGKTTLARCLPDATIVSTDEFWDGQGFDLERLRGQVVEPLLAGRAARYRSYDWEARRERPTPRVVAPHGLIVIEGVCALHRIFREAYDLRVWVEAPFEVRLARGIARDGEQSRQTWLDVWMPMEDRYVERDDPVSAADLVIDGSGRAP